MLTRLVSFLEPVGVIGLARHDFTLLGVYSDNLLVGVTPVPGHVSMQPDVIQVPPAARALPLVGESIAGITLRHGLDLRPVLIGPTGQRHRLIVEEELQRSRERIAPDSAPASESAEVGNAKRLQIGLNHLALRSRVQTSQDRTVRNRLERGGRDALSPADSHFLAGCGPVNNRGIGRAGVFPAQLESLVQFVHAAHQPDRCAAGR